MRDQAILVVGGTSDIARALSARAAAQGARLYLAARDRVEVERVAQDLRVRYRTTIVCGPFEAADTGGHRAVCEAARSALGGLDGVIVSIGILGEQARAVRDFAHAEEIIQSNYTGAASILTEAAAQLEAQGSGFIVGISSVAGDRGRKSNYVYGSAKGAFTLFLQGLRNRMASSNVHVLTVKPGFVDTKMTFGMPGLFLVASPDRIARDILKALRWRRNVIYTPWFWRGIMLIIRTIPEPIFKRLSL